jgi:hypothetical protein
MVGKAGRVSGRAIATPEWVIKWTRSARFSLRADEIWPNRV